MLKEILNKIQKIPDEILPSSFTLSTSKQIQVFKDKLVDKIIRAIKVISL